MDGLPLVLEWSHITALTGVSRKTIERDIRAGTFPSGFCVGVGNRRWMRGDIEAFIKSNPQGRGRKKREAQRA